MASKKKSVKRTRDDEVWEIPRAKFVQITSAQDSDKRPTIHALDADGIVWWYHSGETIMGFSALAAGWYPLSMHRRKG